MDATKFDVILFVLFDQCESTTDVLFKDFYGRNKVRLFKKIKKNKKIKELLFLIIVSETHVWPGNTEALQLQNHPSITLVLK